MKTLTVTIPTAEELQAAFDGSHPSITPVEAHAACREARKRLKRLDKDAYKTYKAIRWQIPEGKERGPGATVESKRAAYVFAFTRLAAIAAELAEFAAIGPQATPLYKPCGSSVH